MVAQVHNTVFISYRRKVSRYLARSLHKDLTDLGYDVFRDVDDIPPGEFKPVILNQIEARAHFIVLIAEDTLDRCSERGDWLRREIEHAMKLKRNIIPILVDGFTFDRAEAHLTRQLKKLKNYQAQTLYDEHYESAVAQLKKKLDYPISVNINLTPSEEKLEVEEIRVEAVSEPKPTVNELSAEFLLIRGFVKQKLGDFEGAAADYTEAIHLNPNYAEAYNDRGNSRAMQGDFVAAIDDFNRAIELNPKLVTAFVNRASVNTHQNDFAAAIDDFNHATELNPKLADIFANRGIMWVKQGDFAAAIEDFNHAIELNPKLAEAFGGRGVARSQQSRYIEAIADYNRAIGLNPTYHRTYYNRGNVRYRQGKFATAKIDYEKAIKLNPTYESAHNRLAESLFGLRQYEKALSDFQNANKIHPNSLWTLAGLAVTYHTLGNVDEAKRLWKQLLDKDARYNDAEWVKQELNWAEPLVDEARKLIAGL